MQCAFLPISAASASRSAHAAMARERKHEVIKLGLHSNVSGALATCMSGASSEHLMNSWRVEPPRWCLSGAHQQRGDPPNGHASVFAGRLHGLHFELVGAVALRGQVLWRHLKVLS